MSGSPPAGGGPGGIPDIGEWLNQWADKLEAAVGVLNEAVQEARAMKEREAAWARPAEPCGEDDGDAGTDG